MNKIRKVMTVLGLTLTIPTSLTACLKNGSFTIETNAINKISEAFPPKATVIKKDIHIIDGKKQATICIPEEVPTYEFDSKKISSILTNIENANLGDNFKWLIQNVIQNCPNKSCYEAIQKIGNKGYANEFDLSNFFISAYNGVFSNINSTENIYYEKEKIKLLDNRNGILNIPNCIFFLKDPSMFGDSVIYSVQCTKKEDVTAEYFFITDITGNLKGYAKYETESKVITYNEIKENCTLVDLETFLQENDALEYIQDYYEFDEFRILKDALSRYINMEDLGDIIDSDKLFVMESKDVDNSEVIDTYSFLAITNNYLFEDADYVMTDLYNNQAVVSLDESGFNGLQYTNIDKNINFSMRFSNLKKLMTIEEFLEKKGLSHLIKQDGYSYEDLENIKIALQASQKLIYTAFA